MKVRVEISGILRKPTGAARLELELDGPTTAAGLLPRLGYSEREQRALRLSRAGEVLAPGAELRDGDELIVFTAVGGG